MKFRPCTWTRAACLTAALTMTIQLIAQDDASNKGHQPRYSLVDLGTFGGGWSFIPSGPPLLKILNNQGAVIGFAGTSISNPYAPICFTPDCLVAHAFKWENGV